MTLHGERTHHRTVVFRSAASLDSSAANGAGVMGALMTVSRISRVRRLMLSTCAALLLTSAGVTSVSAHAASPVVFAIEAQDLGTALKTFALQAKRDIFFAPDLTAGKRTSGVKGDLSPLNALDALLAGTGLTYRVTASNAILIEKQQVKAAAGEAQEGAAPPQTASDQPSARTPDPSVEKVTVTGTRIRGAKVASPVITITQEEMRMAGHSTLGEAARALPQNFSGGQNPTVGLGAANNSANFTGSSSFNLRGLGSDATLTLLNGSRLPYDGTIQATDVASIPMAAVERIEILLDGASAIYGSDAVGGVANVILKRDFDGAEFTARIGEATSGGFDQEQYSAVAGTNWVSGGFIVTGDFSSSKPIRASEREYLRSLPKQYVTIMPDFSSKSAVFSGHQALGSFAEVTLDAFYTDRRSIDMGATSIVFDNQRDSEIWSVMPALRLALSDDWSVRLHGAIGQNDSVQALKAYNATTGAPLVVSTPLTLYHNKAETAGVEVEGPLFDLPGGEARLSVGGGYRNATFLQQHLLTGVTTVTGEANSHHAYGELNLPVISDEQAIPLVSQLTFSGAVRYESHDGIGETTTPKLGVIWGTVPGLDLRASWGKSFKAPTLVQQYQATAVYLYPSSFFGGVPAGQGVIFSSGGNPDLQPEEAEVMTAGFVADPEIIPGLRIEFNWFDIEYTDRIVTPLANLALLADPAYASFTTFSPSVAQQNAFFAAMGFPVGSFTLNATGVAYNPANVAAMLDNRNANATADHATGVDLTARYGMDAFDGRLTFTANGSWIETKRQLTAVAPEFAASGALFFPSEFKGRVGVNWSRDGLSIASIVNHIDGITNTNFVPNVTTEGMTTLDLVFDYQFESEGLGGFGFNVAVINAFDEEPPYIRASQAFYPPYDSTNYSALGRYINATVTKRF
jgi:outer membrane receptor protein involved in Fe transport